MKHQHRLAIATAALLAAFTASAQTVYKSVDARGRVSYSSTPPITAPEEMIEKVKIAPGPTEQQKQDAAQRAKALETDRGRAEATKQEQQTPPSRATADDRGPTSKSSNLDPADSSRWRAPRAATHDRATRRGIER